MVQGRFLSYSDVNEAKQDGPARKGFRRTSLNLEGEESLGSMLIVIAMIKGHVVIWMHLCQL